MTEEDQINALKKEAEIYFSQGLIEQSMLKFLELKDIVSKSEFYSEDVELNRYLKDKINLVSNELEEINTEREAPLLDDDTQDLIEDLFAFSDNDQMNEIESAVALAKFGQYEKALEEFNKLLDNDTFPLVSAKNILRCYISLSASEKAVSQIKEWDLRKKFTGLELLELKKFLKKILKENRQLLLDAESEGNTEESEDDEEEYSDFMQVYSICLHLKHGQKKVKKVDLKVTSQSGNKISFILQRDQKNISDSLAKGLSLQNVQCFSKESVFNTRAVVSKKAVITSGPYKDGYSFDLKLEDISTVN